MRALEHGSLSRGEGKAGNNVLADIFKVKVPVEPPDEGGERDQELGERRVHVHKEGLLDVFAGKAAKVDFVEATGQSG